MTWPDGRVYEGEFKQDKREGTGTFSYPDGRQYIGLWTNNKQDGEGKYRPDDNSAHREGLWKDGKRVQWMD